MPSKPCYICGFAAYSMGDIIRNEITGETWWTFLNILVHIAKVSEKLRQKTCPPSVHGCAFLNVPSAVLWGAIYPIFIKSIDQKCYLLVLICTSLITTAVNICEWIWNMNMKVLYLLSIYTTHRAEYGYTEVIHSVLLRQLIQILIREREG